MRILAVVTLCVVLGLGWAMWRTYRACVNFVDRVDTVQSRFAVLADLYNAQQKHMAAMAREMAILRAVVEER